MLTIPGLEWRSLAISGGNFLVLFPPQRPKVIWPPTAALTLSKPRDLAMPSNRLHLSAMIPDALRRASGLSSDHTDTRSVVHLSV